MVNETLKTVFADTIYALSSGLLPSGVAVIRISGRHTQAVLSALAGEIPPPRLARLRTLKWRGQALDQALVLFFASPASFTGEDSAEFHVHGGRAVVQAVLEAVGACEGCRMAEAGEFTRRAFLNGKIDLTGAESLADLIVSETEAQRRFAMNGATGAYKDLYSNWMARITHARALIEAELDFADEQDVPGSVSDTVWDDIAGLSSAISIHLDGFRAGEIIREGFSVVLIGAPNAGKSSLLNCLAKRDVAIVTEEAGTTRDLIDVALDIDGYKVIVTDTAGLRESDNIAESIGVRRALERGESADLVLSLTDVTLSAGDEVGLFAQSRISVGTKADMIADRAGVGGFDIVISAKSGEGISALLEMIADNVKAATGNNISLVPTRMRHVDLLRRCQQFLGSALKDINYPLELRTESLRQAGDSLGKIIGAVDVEDLLDVIFSEFCIGK